jgi:bacterioferritin (cytochrome b1)
MSFQNIIKAVTADNQLHARFLMILKHAAEESRHAYYLKKQISKLGKNLCPDYAWNNLLAPLASYHFLHKLDVEACRLLKEEMNCDETQVKKGAYLLVTYAIEVRADMLYGIYQQRLTEIGSKVNVKSIIAEEEGHLAEMNKMLREYDVRWEEMAKKILAVEEVYFEGWVKQMAKELSLAA